ncbi:MAG: chemotaxis protein [Clostridiales bacterium]|nr:chemotaxis protein [Clostridiales bacterium]
MKGTVVSTWVESCRKLFGEQVVSEVLQSYGISKDYIFSPLENVDDKVAKGIVDQIGNKVGKNHKEIWFTMGEENIKTFSQNYPGFFRNESAYQFLRSMNDVHVIVMKRFKGAVPPILDVTPISSKEASFIYRSKRGMSDYLVGLISGVSKYFKEEIEVEVVNQEAGETHLKLTFEKQIQFTKKYRFNQILSFGFIKSAGLKTSILSGILMVIFAVFLTGNLIESFILGGATLAITFTLTSLFNRPRELILKELNELKNRNFMETVKLRSNDEYEVIMNSVNEVKANIQKDFIGFNSMVDELYTFNQSITGISKTMQSTSTDISDVLDEVAAAAMTQAEDTSHATSVLEGSIKNVTSVSDDSQRNQEQIEKAVSDIEDSFSKVETTATKINEVLNEFSVIRKDGNELQNNADNITQIVLIVSSIAKQISLLALNASIEAARAGEAGRGFSVVADEIRKLSEETHNAVNQINQSLTGIVASIGNVVEGIGTQYEVLESENTLLTESVESSSKSNIHLKKVSELLVETSRNLKLEADSISNLFDGIQNLAAIAEENSAATQEANSNVAVYVSQIDELTDQVTVFDSLIQNFQEDLANYHI